jgi:putative phosphoesterase
MTIRIGVLSDTHLHELTDRFLNIINKKFSEVDIILHAGDIVSPCIIDFFKSFDFYAVHGNMDLDDVKMTLPRKRILRFGDYQVGLIHGWGAPSGMEERIYEELREADVIVYGHTHQPANRISKGVLFFNPGTATGYSFDGFNSVGVIELGEKISGTILEV